MLALSEEKLSSDSSKPVPKVLIVEDEALLRAALSEFLLDDGFEVLGAANAAEAMDILTQYAHEIDLVFGSQIMKQRFDGLQRRRILLK